LKTGRLLVTFATFFEENDMGKGDRKTRRGKIYAASYGNKRPHSKRVVGTGAAVVAKPVAKKAAAAKPAAKAPAKKKA
jgi:30S ribosomal protein S31